jgi:AraC-like DNA-binding protein
MSKRKSLQVPVQYWRGGKVPKGEEYYHYPSGRAQEFWHYVMSLGRSNVGMGHQHGHEREDRFLFHYMHRGEFWHTIRGRTHRAGQGAVCLMDLREPVHYGNDKVQRANVWWVAFGGRDVSRLFDELGADENPLFDHLEASRIETLFLELLTLTKRNPPGYEPRASGLLTLLMAELFAARETDRGLDISLVPLPDRQEHFSQPVRDAMRYVARLYDRRLDLKQLSSAGSVSLYHFSRVFQREVGMSPIQYLNRYRVEKAKQALRTTHQPLRDVGEMVGIPDRSRFSRLFHKITGVTPSQFRHGLSRAKTVN